MSNLLRPYCKKQHWLYAFGHVVPKAIGFKARRNLFHTKARTLVESLRSGFELAEDVLNEDRSQAVLRVSRDVLLGIGSSEGTLAIVQRHRLDKWDPMMLLLHDLKRLSQIGNSYDSNMIAELDTMIYEDPNNLAGCELRRLGWGRMRRKKRPEDQDGTGPAKRSLHTKAIETGHVK